MNRNIGLISAGILCISAIIWYVGRPSVPNSGDAMPLVSGPQERRAKPSPLPDGFGDTSSFEMPFLGPLKVTSKPQEFRVPLENGSGAPIVFIVSRLPDGRFVAAEFNKPGAHRYWPTAEVEENEHRIVGEEITGLPKEDGTPMLSKVMSNLKEWVDIENATHVEIKYVMLRGVSGELSDRPVFMAAVYGVKQLEFGTPRPDEERFKVVHYVFNERGELIYGSN